MNNVPSSRRPVVIPESDARRLRWLLGIASVLFLLGIYFPMVTITKLVVFTNSFSIVSGVVELSRNGHILLSVLVAGFSIVLPVLKILVLFKILSLKTLSDARTRRYLSLMHDYGRWAMLDVMVVAVLVVTVKLGAVASIEVHYGLYVFGLSVLLIMLITNRIVRLTSGETGRAGHG